jgi:hypothetical protein
MWIPSLLLQRMPPADLFLVLASQVTSSAVQLDLTEQNDYDKEPSCPETADAINHGIQVEFLMLVLRFIEVK